MRIKWLGVPMCLASAVGGLETPTAMAQEDRVVQMDTLNVRDVLYHLGGGGGNGMALIDEVSDTPGVVLIDTKPSGWGSETIDVLGQVTDLPVRTIINTHAHAEHAGSNAEFGSDVEIIAHTRTSTRMVTGGLYEVGDLGLPTTTVSERYGLLEDIDRIDLYYFGVGHTDGDLTVVFPGKEVAYLSDLFPMKGVPAIDREHGGSGLAFPDTLDRIVSEIYGVSRVITGHGPFPTTYAGRGRRETGVRRAWSGFYTWDDLTEYAAFVRIFVESIVRSYESDEAVEVALANLRLPATYAEYDMGNAMASAEAIYAELDER
ncbi:MAG: MBL fold metallo-hydrolase [Acidobacteriota bacterium]|nr:MBL fold metallo-hydrolase [Acidobacteriota bacterium]